MEYVTNTEKETFEFAKNYAKKLSGGEVIGLIGDLGAGKTVFARGLAAGLGIKSRVTSPTFVLMKIYPVKPRKAGISPRAKLFNRVNPVKRGVIKQLCHIDAYRIKTEADLMAIGAEEYFSSQDTVTLVEWADKVKRILPRKTKFINIEIKKNQRIINTR